jgi:peptide-methionine (S)-S-oxide reductase
LCRPGGDARRSISNIRNFCPAADSIKEALGIEKWERSKEFVMSMCSFPSRASAVLLMVILVGVVACSAGDRASSIVPNPAMDATLTPSKSEQTAVVSGGCFWGIQAVFQHVKGVISATSGYSGGAAGTAEYELVSNGDTGHAESVKITYDPSQITYGQLLRVFFSVAHDPTQLNRQGPDTGSQYRSSIFYNNDEQKRIAEAFIVQLDKTKVFPHPIVTQVVPLKAFYPAEAYHQDYATRHPDSPYIIYNDAPKVAHLRQQFPDLYTGK